MPTGGPFKPPRPATSSNSDVLAQPPFRARASFLVRSSGLPQQRCFFFFSSLQCCHGARARPMNNAKLSALPASACPERLAHFKNHFYIIYSITLLLSRTSYFHAFERAAWRARYLQPSDHSNIPHLDSHTRPAQSTLPS